MYNHQAFGTEFNFGSWSMVRSDAHPHSAKVNYVPTVFYHAISVMGLAQVCTCTIVWFIFVLGHGPLVVRKAWKQQYQADLKAKLQLEGPDLRVARCGLGLPTPRTCMSAPLPHSLGTGLSPLDVVYHAKV